MVTNRNTRIGWATGGDGDRLCYTAHDWSPNEKQLAYLQDGQLWLAGAGGQNPSIQPSPDGIEHISALHFSPDGTMIAVNASRIENDAAQYAIWILDMTTGTFERLIEDASSNQLAWSPSSDALAFIDWVPDSEQYPGSAWGPWIVKLNREEVHFAALAPPPGTEGCSQPPTWVLGGQKILATLLRTPGVWLMDLDGNVQQLNISTQSNFPNRPAGLAMPKLGGPCDNAITSSDGRYVVYTINSIDVYVTDLQSGNDLFVKKADLCNRATSSITWSSTDPQFLHWGQDTPLELVNATDGSTQTLSPSGLWPAWSPDGQHIVYWQSEPTGYALWLLRLNDLNTTRLTTGDSDEYPQHQTYGYTITPQWSPNGDAIAFASYRDKHPEAYMLSLVER
jgi:Tol biopolymer transport system component